MIRTFERETTGRAQIGVESASALVQIKTFYAFWEETDGEVEGIKNFIGCLGIEIGGVGGG